MQNHIVVILLPSKYYLIMDCIGGTFHKTYLLCR